MGGRKIETTMARWLQGPVLKEIEESCKRLEEDGIIRRITVNLRKKENFLKEEKNSCSYSRKGLENRVGNSWRTKQQFVEETV
ncbi:hypothetical protein Avbf_12732 [Armadillidium vulgare]|nr:hypothetical protein Avbf_12732 [Armadillidium vulgare]